MSMTREQMKELILAGSLSGAYSAGTLEQVLAEFDKLTERNAVLRKAVYSPSGQSWEFTCLELYEQVKDLEDKAEALERICEPVLDANVRLSLSHAIKPLRDLGYGQSAETLKRICDYLDSQQKPCFVCGKTGVVLTKTGEALICEECMDGISQGIADVKAGRVKPWSQVKEELGIQEPKDKEDILAEIFTDLTLGRLDTFGKFKATILSHFQLKKETL